jgi:NAD(P)-dependent dehydrogenase (short-subunit alcohol dehydrogenase family)
MSGSLAGKVALITGASRGIGAAAARLFVERGARVAIADSLAKAGEALAKELSCDGEQAIFVPCDVTRAADCARAVERACQAFGALHLAFNNAGINRSGPEVADYSEEDWDAVVGVNLKGVFLSMKYEIPAILRSGGGAILNTASVGGLSGAAGLSAYCASKHAVIGLTRSAAIEYASRGIRINALCPGATLTDMLKRWFADPEIERAILAQQPMHRAADPLEIARCAAFLLSDEASFVTGAAYPVDGGRMA